MARPRPGAQAERLLAGRLAADPVFAEAQRLAEEAAGFHIGIISLPRRSRPQPPPQGAAANYCGLIRSSGLLVRRCDRSDERGAAPGAQRY